MSDFKGIEWAARILTPPRRRFCPECGGPWLACEHPCVLMVVHPSAWRGYEVAKQPGSPS